MSFNNLAFNISKATATTSTTNVSTPSTANAASSSENLSSASKINTDIKAHGPLIQQISPRITAVGTSEVLATASTSDGNRDKADLIGLFDKFDIDKKEVGDDSDPVAEKFKEFVAEIDEQELTEKNEDESEKLVDEVSKDHRLSHGSSSYKEKQAYESMTMQPYEIPESTEESAVDDEITEIESFSGNKEELEKPQDPVENSTSIEETTSENRQPEDLLDFSENSPQPPVEEYELRTSGSIAENSSSEEINAENTTPKRPSRTRNNSIKSAQLHLNPSEQYQQSHRPFDFQVFLAHLRKKSADPIVRYIRSFLVNFTKQCPLYPLEQKKKIINDFKLFITQKFELYEPFASMDPIDLENSREGVEKLLMNRLYDFCFPPEILKRMGPNNISLSTETLIKKDEEFTTQIEKFSWVNGHHLDIDLEDLSKFRAGSSKNDMDFMEYSISELNKLNNYRAPRDKIICILNACKIIFSFLKVRKQETNADAFIPLLILIIIKAKTPNLISNIHYIEYFRGEEWLNHGETSYYLSSLQGAVGFIEDLDFDRLTISREEYDAHMEAWDAEHKQAPTSPVKILQPQPHHLADTQAASQGLSPSNVLFTSAEMFTKSLSNFLSPSPQEQRLESVDARIEETEPQPDPQQEVAKETYKNLREIFPNIDKAVLKDIVLMKKGDMDESLDACLLIVNDT